MILKRQLLLMMIMDNWTWWQPVCIWWRTTVVLVHAEWAPLILLWQDRRCVTRLSCFTHTIQLVVWDCVRKLLAGSGVLSKVSKLAYLVHHSAKFKEAFEQRFGYPGQFRAPMPLGGTVCMHSWRLCLNWIQLSWQMCCGFRQSTIWCSLSVNKHHCWRLWKSLNH